MQIFFIFVVSPCFLWTRGVGGLPLRCPLSASGRLFPRPVPCLCVMFQGRKRHAPARDASNAGVADAACSIPRHSLSLGKYRGGVSCFVV